MEKEVLDYICHDIALTSAVSEMARLNKANERLVRNNRCITAMAIVTLICLITTNNHIIEQQKTIRQLKREIKGLKKAKGE